MFLLLPLNLQKVYIWLYCVIIVHFKKVFTKLIHFLKLKNRRKLATFFYWWKMWLKWKRKKCNFWWSYYKWLNVSKVICKVLCQRFLAEQLFSSQVDDRDWSLSNHDITWEYLILYNNGDSQHTQPHWKSVCITLIILVALGCSFHTSRR